MHVKNSIKRDHRWQWNTIFVFPFHNFPLCLVSAVPGSHSWNRNFCVEATFGPFCVFSPTLFSDRNDSQWFPPSCATDFPLFPSPCCPLPPFAWCTFEDPPTLWSRIWRHREGFREREGKGDVPLQKGKPACAAFAVHQALCLKQMNVAFPL